MGSKVGAKIEIFKMLKEGQKTEQEIRDHVSKKFPNVKKYSINKYFADYRSNNPRKEGDQISIDHNDSVDVSSTDSVRLSDIPYDQSIKKEKDDQNYDVGSFQYQVVETDTPPEAALLSQRFKDGMVNPEPVKLEFVPKIFKRGFKVIQNWKPLKEKLTGWEDQKSVDDLADEIENSIKKRVHASTKNADLINIGLAASVVAVSMGAHILTGKKEDIKKELKVIQQKSPKIATQVRNMEKEVSNAYSEIKRIETQNGASVEIDKTQPEIAEHLTADRNVTDESNLDTLGQ